jgi:hypothetical protein
MKITFCFLLFFVLLSCTAENDRTTREAMPQLRTVEMKVAGMVGEVNCVSSIQKVINVFPSVHSSNIDFKPNRKKNTISITFDTQKGNEIELQKSIENINDGQYKVVQTNILPTNSSSVQSSMNTPNNNSYAVAMSEKSWKFPNLFDLLSSIIY